MAFPSERFYNGQLMIGSPVQALPSPLPIWPSGSDAPIAFVDVVGVEETLTVSTEEGSLKSKSNQREITLVVSTIEYSNIYATVRFLLVDL
jgi:superfamily I DNA and/or RNA helicase